MDNSANNKRIAKNTIYLYIRMLVSLLIGLYTSRVFLEALGVEDYGIYNIVGGFVALFAILTNTIRSAAQRFITYALGQGDSIKLRQTFSTFITLYIIVAIGIFLIGEIIGILALNKILVLPENRLNAAYFVYHCSLFVFSINLVAIPYNACIVAHEKMSFYAIISVGESIVKLLIAYLLFISPFDTLKTYAFLLGISSLLVLTICMVYCKIRFSEVNGRFVINKPIFKEIFSYSAWVIIGSSSVVVKEQGVNLVINRFCGVAMNAAKGVSMQVEHVVSAFATNIGTAITPQITKSYASGDIGRAIRLTFLMAKTQGLLLLFLCLPLITESSYILSLWLKDVPEHASLFTEWVLILSIARTLDGAVVPLHLAIGKQKYIQLVCGGMMLMNLPLSYFVLKIGFDPIATVIVGIIIEFVVLFIVTLFLKKYIQFPVVDFFRRSILSVITVGGITMLALNIMVTYIATGFIRLLFVCVASTVLISVLSYLIALDSNEKDFVIDYLKKKIGVIK